MILPGSQLYNLILLAIGMLCWGLWASTFKMTSKWRFELYSIDFAVGVLLAALLVGFTFGSLGWDGFALLDDLRIAGKREDAIAAAAGVVFNLGNMLMMGALAMAGVSAMYVIGMGLMMTVGLIITYFTAPSGNGMVLAIGAVLVLGAAILLAVTSRQHSLARLVVLMREGKTKSTKKVVSVKGLVMAALGGLVASAHYPLVVTARTGDNGVGPYGLGLFFAVGLLFSTFLFNLFFMNLPVQGDAIEFSAYFQGKAKSHWMGIIGGMLWFGGFISLLVVARAEGRNAVPPVELRAVTFAAPIVGVLTGLTRWKDFKGAEGKLRTFLMVALVLLVIGVALLSLSANYSIVG